jgi:hypothetical protein
MVFTLQDLGEVIVWEGLLMSFNFKIAKGASDHILIREGNEAG